MIIPDAAVEEDIVALRSGMSDRSTLRRLMRYSVAVYESELYDIRTGLNVNAEGGRAICF